jgi:hypothetical protein
LDADYISALHSLDAFPRSYHLVKMAVSFALYFGPIFAMSFLMCGTSDPEIVQDVHNLFLGRLGWVVDEINALIDIALEALIAGLE